MAAGSRALTLSERLARPTVMAVGLAFVVTNLAYIATLDSFAWDVDAYWDAAMRLREGQALYVPHHDVDAPEVYRYAPWFAWAWVPLTYFSREAVDVAWISLMLVCSCLAVWPAAQTKTQAGLALALLTWPMLAYVSFAGNVHAAMVAGLVYGVGTRWGPLAIAVAASLKAVPLALALVYLGRRQYWRLAATAGLTALLVTPMLFYELENYTTNPGAAVLLAGPAWWVGVGMASVATVALASTRYGWLAGAATAVIAFPRWFVYDVALILAGTRHRD